jgi:hypothetical protein
VIAQFPVQRVEEQEKPGYEAQLESLKDELANSKEALQRVNIRHLTEDRVSCMNK